MEQDLKWLIVQSNIITVGNNFHTVYMSDFKYFGTRREAILHGLEMLKHDDFNIIQICNKKVLSMWWMDKEVNKDYKEVYKEIEEQLFL